MRNLFLILFVSATLFNISARAQFERETRAVWLATNFRLDWPPNTFDAEKQKQDLIQIFDNIKSKNLNTVYFQAESNGTAMFRSSYEPLSPYITGEVNGKASYDPLEFAIAQAHKRGLEIHAWVNVFKCFNGSETYILNNPDHIAKKKPEWVIEETENGQKSYWLDPGLPEVREYVSDLIAEMVEKYNLDGVQLDYIRYPGKNFDDDFSYGIYGKNLNRDEWRRQNITGTVELIYKKIKAERSFVKVGAAPIGIYKNINGANGWQGYSEIYQDSREWLKLGIIDYLAPQIYWGIGDKPRFDVLAKDWAQNSFGRNIVIGMGAYKENVRNDLNRMIEYVRAINAAGVAFFRYSNIKDYNFQVFPYKTFPSSMAWLEKDGSKFLPLSPENFKFQKTGDDKNIFILTWDSVKAKSSLDSARYFALYSLPDSNAKPRAHYLFDLIPANQTSLTIAIDKPKRINYYFSLKSVNKLWDESRNPSNSIEIKFTGLNRLAEDGDILSKPVLIKDSESSARLFICANAEENIEISGGTGVALETTVTENLLPGKNIVTLSSSLLSCKILKIVFKSSGKVTELKL